MKDVPAVQPSEIMHPIIKFKARPFIKEIFERKQSLSLTPHKKLTTFNEFSLSQSNSKLSRNNFDSSLENKEKATDTQNSN